MSETASSGSGEQAAPQEQPRPARAPGGAKPPMGKVKLKVGAPEFYNDVSRGAAAIGAFVAFSFFYHAHHAVDAKVAKKQEFPPDDYNLAGALIAVAIAGMFAIFGFGFLPKKNKRH